MTVTAETASGWQELSLSQLVADQDGHVQVFVANESEQDVFMRREYACTVVESLNYCHREKGLLIYVWPF